MNINKSNLYYNKFKRTVDYEFHLFIYLPVSKASFDSAHTQNLYDIDLARFTLPSAFKVVKEQKVQAPQVSMAYSSYKTFINLKKMYDLNAFSFKHRTKWYAYALLQDLKIFKDPSNLCSTTHQSFFEKPLKFSKLRSTHLLGNFCHYPKKRKKILST